jgi:hypothetical protein
VKFYRLMQCCVEGLARCVTSSESKIVRASVSAIGGFPCAIKGKAQKRGYVGVSSPNEDADTRESIGDGSDAVS